MKHFVFVESNTTGTGELAVQKLLVRQHRVTFLTRTPWKYPLLANHDAGLCVRELDTNNFQLLLATLKETQAREEIDAILTFSEFYVPIVSELAAALGLPGLDPKAARVCRHKPTTRSILAAVGLVTPEFHVLTSREHAEQVATTISYPCVVKPPSDSSSHGVRLVRDPIEFLAHYETIHAWTENVRGQSLDGTVLAETLLEGPEYSVESFTTKLGATHVIGVTDKHVSLAPYFVETGHDFPSCESRAIKESLVATVLRALDAVGFNFGPAHTEIRLTKKGPAIVEINPRLAGGMIPELIKYATGIDVFEAWISLLLGNEVSLAATCQDNASIRFLMAQESGRVVAIRGVEEARKIPSIHDVVVTANLGAIVRSAEDAYDRFGFIVASGNDRSELREDLAAACRTIRIDVEAESRELVGSGTK
jgi:S-sulfo-L-cysteine synthase (3-phospho-L-serine-dependent)